MDEDEVVIEVPEGAAAASSWRRAAPMVVAGAVACGVTLLAVPGEAWSTPGWNGAVAGLGRWALAVAVAWLVAGAGLVARRLAPAGRFGSGRVPGALAAGAGVVTGAALGAATVRLVRAALDDTTVAAVAPTPAGWLAPLVLVVVLAIAGWMAGGRARVAAAGLAVVALVVGAGLGALGPAVPTGVLTGRPGAADLGGAPPRKVFADLVAPMGGAVYAAVDDRIEAIDEWGRWFPVVRADDVRPPGYVGHIRDGWADTVARGQVQGLFARGDELILASDRAVFTVVTPRTGRVLVALADDRSEASLATLAAAGAAVLAEGTRIMGVGPDGSGGLVVVTDAAVVRVGADGRVDALPAATAARAAVAESDGARVVVHGRADGSVVLGVRCTVLDVAATGVATVLADRGADCDKFAPPPIAVAPDGTITAVTADRRMSTAPAAFAGPEAADAVAAFDDDGRLVVAYRGDRSIVRSPAVGR